MKVQKLLSTSTTGRTRLIRIHLIQSAPEFEVVVNIWQDSYYFMFKMHG